MPVKNLIKFLSKEFISELMIVLEHMKYYRMNLRNQLMISRWDLEGPNFKICIIVANRQEEEHQGFTAMMNMKILINTIREQNHKADISINKHNSSNSKTVKQVKSFGRMLITRRTGLKMTFQREFGMNSMTISSLRLIMIRERMRQEELIIKLMLKLNSWSHSKV